MNELPVNQIQGEAGSVAPIFAPPRPPRNGGVKESGGKDTSVRTEQPQKGDRALERDPTEELERITAQLNESIPPERGIRFQLHGEGSDLVVQVVNLQSDEVIRSIPPERLVDFREDFRELTGLLLDDRA